MNNLSRLIPDVGNLLALEPEELAAAVLNVLNSIGIEERNLLHRGNFCKTAWYGSSTSDDVYRVLSEAWSWLEREGLIAQDPRLDGDWIFVTRRGKRLVSSEDFEAYRNASILPKALLHPALVSKVEALFLRGDYDTAVFQAFKEVEVSVRKAAKLDPTDIGVPLMRKAFDKSGGPLTDMGQPEAEREALAHLFAGATGLFKNPQSHRQVRLSEPGEVVELLLFASLLLRIVEQRIEAKLRS